MGVFRGSGCFVSNQPAAASSTGNTSASTWTRPDPVGPSTPEYHPIDVVGTPANDIELETPAPWQLVIHSSALPTGRKGFRLIGATRRQYFLVRRSKPP